MSCMVNSGFLHGMHPFPSGMVVTDEVHWPRPANLVARNKPLDEVCDIGACYSEHAQATQRNLAANRAITTGSHLRIFLKILR
jgi:hypothetical protein